MGQIEELFELPVGQQPVVATLAEIVALVDALGSSTLDKRRLEMLRTLRGGILSLSTRKKVTEEP